MLIAPPAIARLVKDARLQASLERSQIDSGGGVWTHIPDDLPRHVYQITEVRKLP
jgi:hypothetical protein